MVFWIYYPDETKERYEEYSPELLCIKIQQLIKLVAPNADVTTQRVQSALVIASLLFDGKAQYPSPRVESNPLFTIVNEKP